MTFHYTAPPWYSLGNLAGGSPQFSCFKTINWRHGAARHVVNILKIYFITSANFPPDLPKKIVWIVLIDWRWRCSKNCEIYCRPSSRSAKCLGGTGIILSWQQDVLLMSIHLHLIATKNSSWVFVIGKSINQRRVCSIFFFILVRNIFRCHDEGFFNYERLQPTFLPITSTLLDRHIRLDF